MQRASIFTSLVLALGCASGDGKLTTEVRSATGFSRIENDSRVAVEVVPAAAFSVEATIDENLQGALVTAQSGDTLRIASPTAFFQSSGSKVVVRLPVPAALTLVNAGSAPLTFDGAADQLTLEVAGSGPGVFTGSANALEARLTGSAPLDARTLTARAATLKNTGSGNLSATVDESVALEATGSGTIDWYGAATVTRAESNAPGKITHH